MGDLFLGKVSQDDQRLRSMPISRRRRKKSPLRNCAKETQNASLKFYTTAKKLSFTQDPDYKYIIDSFEGCMKNHDINPAVPDFIWNKNRLVLEKEAIKA